MEDLYQFAEGSECVIIFADADLRLIDMVGDQTVREELERLGLRIGTCWSEEWLGANALALALQESFPIQLKGAMHYLAALHTLYTSAAPIHDLLGQAVGVLAAIGRYEHAHPHTLSMITAAAQAISNQLQMQVWLGNANDLLSELKTILQTLPEGILLLRRDGVVSQMNTPVGTMLGLTPARVTGRRLRDVLPLPTVLAQALTTHQSLSDEELVFDTVHGRVTCLCTLKPLTSYRPETGLEGIVNSVGLVLEEQVVVLQFASDHDHLLAVHGLRDGSNEIHASLQIDRRKASSLHRNRVARADVRHLLLRHLHLDCDARHVFDRGIATASATGFRHPTPRTTVKTYSSLQSIAIRYRPPSTCRSEIC